jgi:hypothetical protein
MSSVSPVKSILPDTEPPTATLSMVSSAMLDPSRWIVSVRRFPQSRRIEHAWLAAGGLPAYEGQDCEEELKGSAHRDHRDLLHQLVGGNRDGH